MPPVVPTDYRLDRWVWELDASFPGGGYWRAPDGCFSVIDLRGASQGNLGGTPEGWGFFAAHQGTPVSADGVILGTSLDADMDGFTSGGSIRRNIWRDMVGLGVTPQGATLIDVLAIEQMGALADPDGGEWNKPGTPTHQGEWEVHLAGHSKVFDRKWAHMPEAAKQRVYLRMQRSYRAIQGRGRDKLHLQWLECMRRKMGLTADQAMGLLIPSNLPKERPVRPSTTITESFNKADADTLGPDLTWTETAGDIDVVSNRAQTAGTTGENTARAESALSSDDHYAQVLVVSTNSEAAGVCIRFGGTGNYYLGRTNSNPVSANGEQWNLHKKVSGSFSLLAQDGTGWATANNNTIKAQADGSAIKLYQDDVEKLSTSDMEISGNLECGIHGWEEGHIMESFEAADLVAAGGFTPRMSLLGVG